MADRALKLLRRRTLLAAAGASLLTGRSACLPEPDGARALHLGTALLGGDVVFRSGLSVESEAVLAAHPRSRFSHVGIVVPSRAGPHVVHALPPEPGFSGGVVLTTWASFAIAADVRAIGAFRVTRASAVDRERIAAEALRLVGTPFNSGLHLDPRHGVYCTQLALAALASVDPYIARFVQPTQLALVEEPVYLPDSLLEWPRLAEISA